VTAVTIAVADPADLDDVLGLPDLSASTRRLLPGDLASPRRRVLVARRGPAAVGVVVVTTVPDDEVHLVDVAVVPEERHRGLATRLLATAAAAAMTDGATAMTLEVRLSNAPARALYRRLGFVEEGVRPGYYQDGEDAMIMWHRRLGDLAGLAGPVDRDVAATAGRASAPGAGTVPNVVTAPDKTMAAARPTVAGPNVGRPDRWPPTEGTR
jgi:ribosomal-protein-alanine N-acetyltransferase